MSERPCFLDVNVPMYAAGKAHPYKEACVWIMGEIANGRLQAVIDTEIIQEVLYRYAAIKRRDLAVTIADSLLTLFPTILPVTGRDMQTAVALFQQDGEQGVQARDVVHAAVMLNNDLTTIISTDSHFDLLPTIVRIDPQRLFTER